MVGEGCVCYSVSSCFSDVDELLVAGVWGLTSSKESPARALSNQQENAVTPVMNSSYRFLLSGAADADKSGLLGALLRRSPHTELRTYEREYSLESEQYRYTLIERGAQGEVAPYLLKEASRLDGVIWCLNAASLQQPHFTQQLSLLKWLAAPLHAIVLTKISVLSDQNLALLSQQLRQTLRQQGLFCEQFVLLHYTQEEQAQVAEKLLESMDARVSFDSPRLPPEALPLRLFMRPRRRTIAGNIYYLASLTQGTLSCGDPLMTNAWRGTAQVAGLCLAHDPEAPLSQVRAQDAPLEIFFAVSGYFYYGELPGAVVSSPHALPSALGCRALVYLPATCLHQIDTAKLTQIEARFAPVYQSVTLQIRLSANNNALVPGGFALAELRGGSGYLLADPGMFFTWQTPSSYPGPRLEAVGRVIELL
jgi:hypothetical protein